MKKSNSERALLIIAVILYTILIAITVTLTIKTFDKFFNNDVNENKEVIIKYESKQNDKVKEINDEYDLADIVENIDKSIVSIKSESIEKGFFGDYSVESSGTGIIYSETDNYYYIVTNNHVIDNSTNITIKLFDNEADIFVDLVGADKNTDIAVLKLKKDDIVNKDDNSEIKPITIGSSSNIRVGDTAIAIGNAYGYSNTVTKGIVSALNRNVDTRLNILSLIQTDAAINEGNSGGPLIDKYGNLIGINTIKIVDTTVEGIGFAIPIDSVKPLIEDIIQYNKVKRPYIGIIFSKYTNIIYNNEPLPDGGIIAEIIENSPAEKNGLQMYDVITSIDNISMKDPSDIIRYIFSKSIGDTINIKVYRPNEEDYFDIELELEEININN